MSAAGAQLTILVPLWKRTAHIGRLRASVEATVPEAQLLFVVSRDDRAVVDVIAYAGDQRVVVDWPGGAAGDYARKINAGYRASDRAYLFTGADDIVFQPGWYDAALDVLHDAPAGLHTRGVVGTVDDCNPRTLDGSHSTHSLVARWYADGGCCVDQAHVIYHEGYDHDYCDDELVRTAMSRGVYGHAFDAHVTHLHHMNGAAPLDPTYERGRARTRHSRRIFRQRQRLWGDR